MTSKYFANLALRRIRCELQVEGVGSAITTYTRGRAIITLASIHDPTFGMDIEFHILDTITSATPVANIAPSCWRHLRPLALADPSFGTTGPIDALIGADIWGALIQNGIVRGNIDEPFAQSTRLGWVVFGPATVDSTIRTSVRALTVHHGDHGETEQRLDELLRKFWELEEAETTTTSAFDTDVCENIFVATHRRDSDGRYVVQIPFRPDAPTLGGSHPLALRQFYQLERKLSANAELRAKYIAFMREYIALGHMRAVDGQPGDPSQSYYIPHHAVTAKFRVVFNASARTTNGVSLNDTQLIGPTIQELLVNIIFRFRRFAVALSADIEKMFRQVRVDKRHHGRQQILWRESPREVLRTYQLTTVTYGMACGPYNAIRALQQCALDNCSIVTDGTRAADARDSILRDFYVDDYLSSVPSSAQAIELAGDIDRILQAGQMHLRKWQSNDGVALATITHAPCANADIELKSPETTVLGLHWNPATDELFYKIKLDKLPSTTKRQILGDTARLYDPTNMLAPVIIVAKIFIQTLWREGLEWDTTVPATLLHEWVTFRDNLRRLEAIRIPRWFGMRPDAPLHIHGFCDASIRAYAAVVYICSISDDGEFTSAIVTSKTKVAPAKTDVNGRPTTTIPRLELCAAQLLATTINNVRKALALHDAPCTLWSDSTIVLSWLRKPAATLKPYAANRIGYIQQHTDATSWRHVRTHLNPADCASRGITAQTLVTHELWWRGPVALMRQNQPIEAPPLTEDDIMAMAAETKPVKANVAGACPPLAIQTHYRQGDEMIVIDLVDRFSRIGRLLRTTAYVFRGCAKRDHCCQRSIVSSDELNIALQWHIRAEQRKYFGDEVQKLSRRNDQETTAGEQRYAIAASSALLPFTPYMDPDGIIRVGGRIRHADLSHDQRFPIILARRSTLAKLIIQEIHQTTLHGGIQLMLQTLRQKYWVLNARTLVKQCIGNCVICRRHSRLMTQQQMASLPRSRVTEAPPFSSSGVDYCGPFNIRIGSQRTRTTKKTYVSIFICMVTKAVHIELAEDLSARAFLNTFTRFISRRGPCHHLYSDNGTQFVKGNKLLQSDLAEWQGVYTQQALANQHTHWHFISAGAPHQGGLWEAAVKSAKRHLLRVIGDQSIYYDQLNTLLARIEACLNSRPLIALHDSVDDRLALTPADFLIGRSLVAVAEPPAPNFPANRLKYWQHLRQMHQSFWRQWHDEYLASLQRRTKWRQESDNLRLNDVVVIRHENLPPTKWRLGRIIGVHPGSDGLVRNVTVQYQWRDGKSEKQKQCTRPVQKICRLLSEKNGS